MNDVHPYPAKFISEIPRASISLTSVQGAVLDPFCGSGTSLVEAVRAGREAIGIDLNPIATLISRAKLAGWNAGDDARLHVHRAGLAAAVRAGDDVVSHTATQSIPRLSHWFSDLATHALGGATAYVRALEDPRWRDILATAVSSIVVRISNQDSDTRYAAVEKNVSLDSMAGAIEKAVDRVAGGAALLASQAPTIVSRVETADARSAVDLLESESVAVAVFSPPYPNAYEYWLYHKYRMYWLGFDPLGVRSAEIGARPFYSGSGKSTEDDFARQVAEVFRGVAAALVPGGIAVVVIGDSIIRGRYIDNAALLTDVAHTVGMDRTGIERRTIKRTRRSFNLAVARAKHEHVLLFEKS